MCFHSSNVIITAFEKAGLWSIDRTRLRSLPRLRDADGLAPIISAYDIEEIYKHQRMIVRERILGVDVHVACHGFVDTRRGTVLTSNNVLRIVKNKKSADAKHRQEREWKAFKKEQSALTANHTAEECLWRNRA